MRTRPYATLFTRDSIVVLRVELSTERVGLAIETQQRQSKTRHIERLWEISTADSDSNAVQRLLYGSLAQIPFVDAVLIDTRSTCCDDYVDSTIDACHHFGQTTNVPTLSIVLCIAEANPIATTIERRIRQTVRAYASAGIRINIVYTLPSEHPSLNATVRYLLTDASHHMSGAVMDANGKILLGSMLEAERALLERSVRAQD